MRLDSHQHFWRYTADDYPWMTDALAALRRDALPADLEPLLAAADLVGSIAVQATQTVAETRWLLNLADEHPFIKGVVGWVDLCSEHVEDQLAELTAHPRLVGVRHVVQDEPDDRFLLRDDFRRGLARLRAFGLTYDLLIYPRQLPAAIELVEQLDQQPFVLDHLAKPAVRDGALEPWRAQIRRLARCPNVCAKISGLVTEARWREWRADDFRPYLDVALEAFGPKRLMFGSDWPVCTLAASYADVFRLADDHARALSAAERAGLFGDNAARFYNLDP